MYRPIPGTVWFILEIVAYSIDQEEWTGRISLGDSSKVVKENHNWTAAKNPSGFGWTISGEGAINASGNRLKTSCTFYPFSLDQKVNTGVKEAVLRFVTGKNDDEAVAVPPSPPPPVTRRPISVPPMPVLVKAMPTVATSTMPPKPAPVAIIAIRREEPKAAPPKPVVGNKVKFLRILREIEEHVAKISDINDADIKAFYAFRRVGGQAELLGRIRAVEDSLSTFRLKVRRVG
jgi:hypothetical protein